MKIDLSTRVNFRGETDERLANEHTAIFGKSGSGKSTVLKLKVGLKKKDRIVIWDPDGTHIDKDDKSINVTTNHRDFWEILKAAMASGKRFKLIFKCANTEENFQFFCLCITQVASADRPLKVLLEELHQVTGTSESKGYHQDLLSRARKYAVRLISISPKPQLCDKDTVSNSEHVYCCKLGRFPDREYMGKEMGVSATEIEQMGNKNIDQQRINWFYRDPEGKTTEDSHEFEPDTATG